MGLLIACLAAAACASPPAPPSDGADEDGFVTGMVSNRYRGRWAGDNADHDDTLVLDLQIGDARRHSVTGHVSGRMSADLDGKPDDDGDDDFFSLQDTYDSRVTAQLHTAYADFQSESFEVLRFGRQWTYETPVFAWFDGVRVESSAVGDRHGRYGVYGGVPVHLYESSPSGDAILGTFLTLDTWEGGRARLDWMHIEDETQFGEEQDDLLGLGVWQRAGKNLHLEGHYTHLEGNPRDARVNATWFATNDDVVVRVSHYELLESQGRRTLELDEFSESLFELFPFRQSSVLLSKGFGDRLHVEGGVDVRRVDDGDDVGEFNRDFERGFATAILGDSAPGSFTVSLTGEVWNATDTDYRTWGVDVERRAGEGWGGSVGSYYSLYKIDHVLGEERDDVRTSYVRLRHRWSDGLTLDLRYEYEDSEFDDYHTLRWVTTWRF